MAMAQCDSTRPASESTPNYCNLNLGHVVADRYVIGPELGRGGHGVVYKGFDLLLRRSVAVKAVTRDSGGEERGLREAHLLARVHDRHVVTLFDCVRQPAADFLVMELVTDTSPWTEGKPLVPPTAVGRFGIQLALGLRALHAANIAHNDIKPANLRLDHNRRLKILDLGIARAIDARHLGPDGSQQVVHGTIAYMAPERLRGDPGDAMSDIWSAGAVLFEYATGERLADTLTRKEQDDLIERGRFPAWFDLSRRMPRLLAQAISQALAPDRRDRPRSAHALARLLRNALSPVTSATPRPLTPPLAIPEEFTEVEHQAL